MTWTRTLATGSGKLEARFVIEGLPYEFVTTRAMESAATSTQPRRIVGLKKRGLEFGDRTLWQEGKFQTTAPSISLADVGGNVTLALSRFPTVSTYLNEELDTSETAITVTSNAGFTAGNIIHINTEAMYVTSVSGGDTINVTRAVYGTKAQKHYIPNGDIKRNVEVTNYPLMIEGRRCFLYVYGEGDSPTGDGSIVWRGQVSGDSRMDRGGTIWTIPVSGLDRLLEQSEGVPAREDLAIRGVYYSARVPFVLKLFERSGDNIGDSISVVADDIQIIGFFESQQKFVDELNTQITAVTGSFTQRIYAEVNDANSWNLKFVTSAASAKYVSFDYKSTVDTLANSPTLGTWTLQTGISYAWVGGVGTNSVYFATFNASVPRSASMAFTPTYPFHDVTLVDQYPQERLYVDHDVSTIGIDSPATFQNSVSPSPITLYVTDIDTGFNSIDFSDNLFLRGERGLDISGYHRGVGVLYDNATDYTDYSVKITIGDATEVTSGTLSDYLDNILNLSMTLINAGSLPFITIDEIDQATSTDTIDVVVGSRPYARNRNYGMMNKKFSEILYEELKLIGCALAIDANGKMVVVRPTFPNSAAVSVAITNASVLVNGEWPKWERNSYGLVNTVEVQSGYDFREDAFKGGVFVARDNAAFGLTHTAKKVSIKPYSSGEVLTQSDANAIGSDISALFSYPYGTITVRVPITLFSSTVVGTVVSLVTDKVPDFATGTRSSTAIYYGLVTGRRWSLETGQGELELYVPFIRNGGYVPAAYVSSRSGASTTWTITVTSVSPWSSTTIYKTGQTTSSNFAVGMRVRVYEADDDSSPTELAGTVTSVSGDDVGVTFDSVWTPGTSQWVLSYNVATDSALTTAQKAYSYVAGTDMLIDHSTAATAKVFTG